MKPTSIGIAQQSTAKQLASFIDKFDPQMAKLIRSVRAALRKRFPTALELVYDNYNFFVIGYCSTDRASDCLVSLAAYAKGISLCFYYGAPSRPTKNPKRQWQSGSLHFTHQCRRSIETRSGSAASCRQQSGKSATAFDRERRHHHQVDFRKTAPASSPQQNVKCLPSNCGTPSDNPSSG